MKILIVGGYGSFGGRLVELLEHDSRLELIVAGRSLEKARAYCAGRAGAKARLVPHEFDRARDLATQLSAIAPDAVVDASGPFQQYGADSYALVEACIAQKINYLDLADGADFVANIGKLDASAKDGGVFALSGVSSFPVLTVAVVRHLSSGMTEVQRIRGGIAPSPYAGIGGNVIRAIAGYAGKKTTLRRKGKDRKAYPLTETMRYTISPPGRVPLNNKLFSLVEVPDLQLLPQLWPEAEEAWIGAGPVPEILHRALIFLAWLVRLRLLPSLLGMARLMEFATRHFRWGEHRGGMFVEVTGRDKAGVTLRRSWHLLAEGDDGPLIPSMAVATIIHKMLAGGNIATGARSAINDITLEDYDAIFRGRTIYTGTREDLPVKPMPLYPSILGPAWARLPEEIRQMHDFYKQAEAKGMASVRRGDNIIGSTIADLMGFPQSAENVLVRVLFTVQDRAEIWQRSFGATSFSSGQYAGSGGNERLVMERFGILTFGMALVAEDGRLKLVLRRWRAFGIPMPKWLCPRSDSYESVEGGRFNFNVEISHPLTGLIVHYKGWLLRKS